jgi:YHS domain-containing protein
MKNQKRKTRSDKFPLTRHPTGQYCKKIRGKIYYFGSSKKEALQKYLDQATYLHGNQKDMPELTDENITISKLSDIYIDFQFSKVRTNDLTAAHHNEQIGSLKKLVNFLGPNHKIKNISTLDLQNYNPTFAVRGLNLGFWCR